MGGGASHPLLDTGWYPILLWMGEYPRYPPLSWPTIIPGWGVPPSCHGWVPPGKGPGGSGSIMGWRWGTPLWMDRHLWKQYLPHPSDAGRQIYCSLFQSDVYVKWCVSAVVVVLAERRQKPSRATGVYCDGFICAHIQSVCHRTSIVTRRYNGR